jgi:hypothetical protein
MSAPCVPSAVKTLLRQKSIALLCCCLFGGVLTVNASAEDHDSMNCPGTLASTHAALADGDQNNASHLQLSRGIDAGAEFDLDVCAADVTLDGSTDNTFRVTVDIENPSQQHTVADYLQKLDITTSHVKLQLHVFRPLHAKVTIELPAATPEFTLNLGRGDLTLAADRIRGKHATINVGYGHVNFQGNADAYEDLQVNVGLGSMHDHRKDGHNHHFIVARSLEGTGSGSITVNVGMGSVDLNPGQSKPI